MASPEDEPPTRRDDGRDPNDSGDWDDESLGLPEGFFRVETGEFDPASFTGTTSDGKITVGEQIGRGGFSWVFRGRQVSTGQEVAIKFPSRPGEACKRLTRGRKLLGQLNHPNIAKLVDAGSTTLGTVRLPYVAMELVRDARSLSAFCREENLDLPARLEVFAAICDAVAAAHVRNVIHRDLKPGNILISGSGHPCVIDFDIADTSKADLTTLETSDSTRGGNAFTPLYASPEQYAGGSPPQADVDEQQRDRVTPASDVFSLGVILRELMTGKPPRMSAAMQLLSGLQKRVLTDCNALPLGVARITRRCLHEDQSQRYRDAAGLAAAIRECLKTGSWKDPWWRTAGRAAWQVSADAVQGLRDFSQFAGCLADSKTFRQFAMAGFFTAVLATAAWHPVTRWRAERQQAAAYSASIAAIDQKIAAEGLVEKLQPLVQQAEADWHDWRGAARPLPPELVCLRNLPPLGDPPTLPAASAACLSSSGEWLVTAGAGRQMKLSSAAEPRVPVRRLPGLPGEHLTVAIGPGDVLAAGSDAGSWAIWQLDEIDRDSAASLEGSFTTGGHLLFSFSPDGRRLAVVSASGEAEIWRLPTSDRDVPQQLSTFRFSDAAVPSTAGPPSACLSGDGRRLLIGGAAGDLLVFDAETGAQQPAVAGPAAAPLVLSRSADGHRLVSFTVGGRLRWHDPATGRLLTANEPPLPDCQQATFAGPENRLIVVQQPADTGSRGTTLTIFKTGSAATFEPLLSLPVEQPIVALQPGGEGRLLVMTADDWQVWSAAGETATADGTIVAADLATAAASATGPAAD